MLSKGYHKESNFSTDKTETLALSNLLAKILDIGVSVSRF